MDSEMLDRLKNSEFSGVTNVPEVTATFAKTAVKNKDEYINSAWNYLYTDWLKTSMFWNQMRRILKNIYVRVLADEYSTAMLVKR